MADRDPNCIFCKIVAGDLPCHKLHEDQHVLAFLDIGPVSLGHALVIPKHHHVTLDQTPEDLAAACLRVVPRIARAICTATNATAWNLLQNNGRLANQAVNHVHLHIIPRFKDEGLNFTWMPRELPAGDATALREKIVAEL